MKSSIFAAALFSTLVLAAAPSVAGGHGGLGFGADVVNRYVWRGSDFGNAMAVQPSIHYSTGSVEVGAWSSWAINGAEGGNENDLYVSFSAGPVGITVTDYFFPTYGAGAPEFFTFEDSGPHILEVSASLSLDDMPLSLMAAFNFYGDSEDSFWIEASYDVGEIDETAVSLTVGAGNGAYTSDTDPMVASIGVNVSNDDYFASYILNPDKETSFLVVGKSF